MTLAILLLAIIPLEIPVTQSIDQLEVQTYYDGNGKEIFTQSIARNFNPHTNRYECLAWWLVKHDYDVPVRGEILRMDGPLMRRVKVGCVIRSHSQADHELIERKQLPVELRRGMRTFHKETD